ncbi:MAG: hypothetical protein E7062_04975 [Spirochaetaceae bacterium]|nr:hypothetical protein [Spirochaetaceae bacterium]
MHIANSSLLGQRSLTCQVNFHLYHYAGNNPVKYVDPDGESELSILDKRVRFSAQTIGPSNPNYNCHSYSFYDSKGDPNNPKNKIAVENGRTAWVEDPSDVIINDYEKLSKEEANKKGDRVIFFKDENSNSTWDKNEHITHSGIVEKVDNEGNVISIIEKQGEGKLQEVSPYENFYNGIGIKREYLRQKEVCNEEN